MVRISLAPGFRFHPTDDELILYYLKRKILGKKFHYELLQKSASINTLRGIFQDLEWFFFCPREKYASGVRVKRATKNGFWKATGKDRNISWNSKIVGTVKTLIFHLGHAPQGERTNWVIHEYKILDEQLAKAGVQDNCVFCKLFEKKGFGPKNGAQYGAPFNEADWADDDDNNNDNVSQECVLPVLDDGSFPTVLIQNEERHSPHDLYVSRNESPLIPEEGTPSSAVVPTSRLAVDETTDDGMTHLLGLFAHENEKGLNQQADLTDSGKKKLLPSEGSGLYDGLHDLDFWSLMEEDRFDFSTVHNVNDPWTSFLPKDNSNYIELDDFLLPLDCPNVDNGTHPSSLSQTSASYSHENMQQCYSDTGFAGMNQYNSFSANDLAIPRHTYEGGDALAALLMLDHPLYEGSDASYNIDLPIGPLGNAVCTPYKMMERVNYACQTARTFQFWKEYIQIFEIPSGTCMPCRTRIVIKTSHGLLIIMFSGPQCHFWIIDVLKIGDTIVWIPSRVLCKDFVILLCKCSIFLGGCIKPLVMLVDAAGSHLENPHSRFMECFDLQLLSFLLFYFLLMVAPPYISMLR